MLKEPYKRWIPAKFDKLNSFCSFMELCDKETLLKNSKLLNFSEDGLQNFLKLYDYQIKKLYKNFYQKESKQNNC